MARMPFGRPRTPDARCGSASGVQANSVQAIQFERQLIHTKHAERFVHDMHQYSSICCGTPHNDGAAWAGYFSWTLMPSASTVMSPIS